MTRPPRLPSGHPTPTGPRKGRRKGPTPEGELLKQCLMLLEIRGIYHWRNNTGCLPDATGRPVRFGKPGSSDVLGVLGGRCLGRTLALELKAGRNRPTPAQYSFLDNVRLAGGVAVVVRDVMELSRILDALHADPAARFELDGTPVAPPVPAAPAPPRSVVPVRMPDGEITEIERDVAGG